MTESHDKWLETKLREELGIPANRETSYTTRQLLWVRDHRHLPRAELTMQYNRHFNTNAAKGKLTSLCKRHNWVTGRTGRREKGATAWNKGMKGIQLNNGKGCFQKGHIPHTYRPIGSTRIREGYQWIKVADPNQWKPTHRVIWEQANGKVPRTHTLKFLDGDKTNITLNNLSLVSRAELANLNRNHYDTCPSELKPTVMLLSKLETKTFMHIREARQ